MTSLTLSPEKKELIVGTSANKIYRVLTDTLDAMIHTEGHLSEIRDISF